MTKTTYYDLSLYEPSDVLNILNTYNDTMEKIDTAIHTNAEAIENLPAKEQLEKLEAYHREVAALQEKYFGNGNATEPES